MTTYHWRVRQTLVDYQHLEMWSSLTNWWPWWCKITESWSEKLQTRWASAVDPFIPWCRRIWASGKSQWSSYHSIVCVVPITLSPKPCWTVDHFHLTLTKLNTISDAVALCKFSVILSKTKIWHHSVTHLHSLAVWHWLAASADGKNSHMRFRGTYNVRPPNHVSSLIRLSMILLKRPCI